MTNYIGAAPLTMVRTTPGGYVNVYEGDPVPATIDEADLERLLDEGFLVEVDEPEQDEDDDVFDSSWSAADVLAWVDGDPDRAAYALEAENEKGDQARKGLTADLEALVGS